MTNVWAEREAMDALREAVEFFMWGPASDDSPEYPVGPLKDLLLDGTEISDDDLEHLRHFTGLEFLALDNTGISDAAVPHLEILDSLKQLDVRQTKITPASIAALRAALPGCKILSDGDN